MINAGIQPVAGEDLSGVCAQTSLKATTLAGAEIGADDVCESVGRGLLRVDFEGALEGGACVCMLPCGLPNAESAFLERVAKEGLLLSPFPAYVTTRKYLYRVRNRVMAAMAKGVLVVSAGEVSGAAMTGGFGLETGKPVYAFPYTIGVILIPVPPFFSSSKCSDGTRTTLTPR